MVLFPWGGLPKAQRSAMLQRQWRPGAALRASSVVRALTPCRLTRATGSATYRRCTVAAQDDGTRTRRRKPAVQPGAEAPPPKEPPGKRQRRARPEEITSLPATPNAEAPHLAARRQPRRNTALQPDKPTPP